MPIEPNTFQQILELSKSDMSELVETVVAAALTHPGLTNSPTDKMIIASMIAAYTNTMFESCGWVVNSVIHNHNFNTTVEYKSGNGWRNADG